VVAAALVLVGWQINSIQDAVTRSGVLLILLLGMMVEVAGLLTKLAIDRRHISIARADDEYLDRLRVRLDDHALPRVIDMLEYSAQSVLQLLERYAPTASTIRLLIRDPTVVGSFQEHRIKATLRHIDRFIRPRSPGQILIRTYSAQPCLRGRRFDTSLATLSWYLPDIREDGTDGGMEIMGHTNPTIFATTATLDGQHLVDFFSRTFEALWQASTPVGGAEMSESPGMADDRLPDGQVGGST
jgi:hypothetical protein